MGILTLLGFPLLGFIVHLFTSIDSFFFLFYSEYNFYLQLLLGVITGWVIAVIGWKIMLLDIMKEELGKYLNLFSSKSLSLGVIIFVSLSAGIGEEIFFRGVLQPFFGITITSLLFVAIHGYLTPKNWRISIYGLYMVLGIALIGYISDRIGLIAAIFSHATIDFILLLKTKKMLKS